MKLPDTLFSQNKETQTAPLFEFTGFDFSSLQPNVQEITNELPGAKYYKADEKRKDEELENEKRMRTLTLGEFSRAMKGGGEGADFARNFPGGSRQDGGFGADRLESFSSSSQSAPTDFIFEREARRDDRGNLEVYNLPSGDGGGSYEVAGITEKFQPREAAHLRSLIDLGRPAEAEQYAKQFYAKRAAPFMRHTNDPGLQLQLADTVHHRGEGGLRRVLQRATGSGSKDYGELIRGLSQDPSSIGKISNARRAYEINETGWNAPGRKKFHKGLLNRFQEAENAAKSLQKQNTYKKPWPRF